MEARRENRRAAANRRPSRPEAPMSARIDDRMPLVLIAEMAAHIGAEILERDGDIWIAIPDEPNALQSMIDEYTDRRRTIGRLVDDLK
jgi:hypothetical protein